MKRIGFPSNARATARRSIASLLAMLAVQTPVLRAQDASPTPAPSPAATTAAPTATTVAPTKAPGTAAPTTAAPAAAPEGTPAGGRATRPAAPRPPGNAPGQGRPAPRSAPDAGETAKAPPARPTAEKSAPPAAKAPEEAKTIASLAISDGKMETGVNLLNADLAERKSPVKVNLFGKAKDSRVTVFMEDSPVESILDSMTTPNNLIWWKTEVGDYGIGDREYYERNVLPGRIVQKIFRPNNVKASELDRAIKGLLTPNVGSSVADDRTNKLIVNDLPAALERIERFIREIDVQLITRVFYIRKADVEDIAKKIESYKSGPGSIEVDKKTHQIIVVDLLSNIKKMELLIDILDVGPEIVIYDVNNVGIEGKDLEKLKDIIETIRTKDLLFQIDDKQGVIILEDVPEVHERVEQILAEFDKPVRQVLLQAEILSTLFTRTFNFGLQNFQIADDLLSARRQGVVGGAIPTAPATGGSGFTDMDDVFPNASLSGNTVTGNYLSQTVLLQYAATYNETSTRVLLQPQLLVKNQQESKISVGEDVPYLTTFYDNNDNNNNNNRQTTTQSTVQSGLDFTVTPSISNSYLVELELKIDNDTAKPQTIRDGGVDRRVVGKDRQQVETTLQIPSGRTRMIGGLIRNTDSDGSGGLPFLSSLPWVGALFGTKSNSREASNLVIFITPSIVEEEEARSSADGRRGRAVTDYERVPSAIVPSESEAKSALDDPLEAPSDESKLLSGSPEEESESLELMRQQQRRRQESLREDTVGNYKALQGTGSATLNTGAAGAGTPSGSQEGQGGRRSRPFRGGDGNNNNGAGRPVAAEVPAGAPDPTPAPRSTGEETLYR